MARFRNILSVPPGGVWFWESREHFVAEPDYATAVEKLRAILAEEGSSESPEDALARHMCPRMPRGFCSGGGPSETPGEDTATTYLYNAAPYFSKPVALVDDIERRYGVCASCPKFAESVTCFSCRHLDHVINAKFHGRRVLLPEDASTGVCTCAKTFNMVTASVTYDKDEAVWEGAPPTCWRFQER